MGIRTASYEDAEGIAVVHVNSWKTTYKGIISDAYLSTLSVEERMARWKAILNHLKPSEAIFVIEEKDEITGFIHGGKNREDETGFEAEIYAFYLLEEAQGKGYGKLLIQTLANDLESKRYHSIMVWVLERNPALQFYKKMGGEFIRKQEIKIGEEILIETAIGWKDLGQLST